MITSKSTNWSQSRFRYLSNEFGDVHFPLEHFESQKGDQDHLWVLNKKYLKCNTEGVILVDGICVKLGGTVGATAAIREWRYRDLKNPADIIQRVDVGPKLDQEGRQQEILSLWGSSQNLEALVLNVSTMGGHTISKATNPE